MSKKRPHVAFWAVLPGSSPGWTYPLSGSPTIVERHEFCEPLFIQVKQQHQVQAGVHQLTLRLRAQEKFRRFMRRKACLGTSSQSRRRPGWGKGHSHPPAVLC